MRSIPRSSEVGGIVKTKISPYLNDHQLKVVVVKHLRDRKGACSRMARERTKLRSPSCGVLLYKRFSQGPLYPEGKSVLEGLLPGAVAKSLAADLASRGGRFFILRRVIVSLRGIDFFSP